MSMVTTRPSTRAEQSHNVAGAFAPPRFSITLPNVNTPSTTSSPFTSVPPSPQTFSFQDRSAMAVDWPLATNSFPPPLLSNQLPFGNQGSHEMVNATSTSESSTRVGYTTRSTTGALPRQMSFSAQPLGAAELFSSGPTTQSNANGAITRKKRRRYGPKPEPPYACFCGKIFKRHEHMLRHRATHDDKIKYECHICGKCFRRQDVMHRHTMTHTSRSRLQSKMRTTASNTATAASATARRAFEDSKPSKMGRQREKGQSQFDYAISHQDVLEDPSLRVGLGDQSSPSDLTQYNEDHYIAAAQLQSTCIGARYPYAASPANMQPAFGGSTAMIEAGYARSDSFNVMTDYQSRSAVSPPMALYPSVTGISTTGLSGGQFGAAMAPPQLPATLGMATRYDYGSKINEYEASQQYAHSWHGDYGVTPSSVQMAPPESEWSEQSPSTHAFGSPAWSQKAELLGRDHMGSATNRPPLSLLSNRPLSMDAGTRWQQPPPQYQQSHQQQQQPYQPESPLLGANSAHQYARLMRSPTHIMQRRLSSLNAPGGGGSARDSNDGSRSDEHAVKAEQQREMAGGGFGLGLMAQTHAGHDSASLGSAATPCSNGNSGDR